MVDIKETISKVVEPLNKVNELRKRIFIQEFEEQDEGNDIIRGYGWESKIKSGPLLTPIGLRTRCK